MIVMHCRVARVLERGLLIGLALLTLPTPGHRPASGAGRAVLSGLRAERRPGADRAVQPSRQPNVLFLIVDDQRPDTIGALGNRLIRTPNLDRLVASGTVFCRATCAYPLCVPSRAEILTGCTGLRNGVFPPRNRPDLTLPTWQQVMRRAGYHTWWVGKWHIKGRPSQRGVEECLGLFGSGRRPRQPQFDSFGRPVTGYVGWMFQTERGRLMPDLGVGLTPDISARFADAAIEFIRRRPQRPFFLQVNFTAPHDPLLFPPGYERAYDPAAMPVPGNFLPQHPFDHGNFAGRDEKLLPWPRTRQDIRRELAIYYAVISHLDEQVGRILDALQQTGQQSNTIIIYTSDHGLAIGSHGLRGKQNMYEHTINVPLILSGPGVPAGRTSQSQCYLRDLFPTICELTGVPVPDSVEGKSLVPVLSGQTQQLYPFVVGYFHDYQRMIRTERWKLIWYPQIDRQQLFDLDNDPLELHDLSADRAHAGVRADLRARLVQWLKAHGDPLVCKPQHTIRRP